MLKVTSTEFKIHRSKYFKPGHVGTPLSPLLHWLIGIDFQSSMGWTQRRRTVRRRVFRDRCHHGRNAPIWGIWSADIFQRTKIRHRRYRNWIFELRVSQFLPSLVAVTKSPKSNSDIRTSRLVKARNNSPLPRYNLFERATSWELRAWSPTSAIRGQKSTT